MDMRNMCSSGYLINRPMYVKSFNRRCVTHGASIRALQYVLIRISHHLTRVKSSNRITDALHKTLARTEHKRNICDSCHKFFLGN